MKFSPYEPEYSKERARVATVIGGNICWICLLPLGKKKGHESLRRSMDHVIPCEDGGSWIACGNIRTAHRWCNSRRGHHQVTPELVEICQHKIQALLSKVFQLTVTDTTLDTPTVTDPLV